MVFLRDLRSCVTQLIAVVAPVRLAPVIDKMNFELIGRHVLSFQELWLGFFDSIDHHAVVVISTLYAVLIRLFSSLEVKVFAILPASFWNVKSLRVEGKRLILSVSDVLLIPH